MFETEVWEWQQRRWPTTAATPVTQACKGAEEMGEVCGAAVKIAEGRRTPLDLADEMGDVLILLAGLAGRFGWSLNDLQVARWAEVRKR